MVNKREFFEEYYEDLKKYEETYELGMQAYGYKREVIIKFMELFKKLPDGNFENLRLKEVSDAVVTSTVKSNER